MCAALGRGQRPRGAGARCEEAAGHAFHNRKAPMFYVAEPAGRAWHRAERFLARHLPVRAGSPHNSW
jgi:dienelactone hydrolase